MSDLTNVGQRVRAIDDETSAPNAAYERFVEHVMAERDRLREALVGIAGHFVPGERNTYAPAAETLDMIRREAEEALSLGGCPCVGTPDEEDCPHG